MAVRILLVLAVLALSYGCGQSSPPPEQSEKERGGEPRSVTASPSGQQETSQKVEDAKLTPQVGCPVDGNRNQSKGIDVLHEVVSNKRIVFVRGSDITDLYFLGVGGTIDLDANIGLYMISADGTSLTRLTKTTVKE